jgi:hypothetical protein
VWSWLSGNLKLGESVFRTHRDISDVLRHIIKKLSERLVQNIESRTPVTQFLGKVFFSDFGMSFVTVLLPVRKNRLKLEKKHFCKKKILGGSIFMSQNCFHHDRTH